LLYTGAIIVIGSMYLLAFDACGSMPSYGRSQGHRARAVLIVDLDDASPETGSTQGSLHSSPAACERATHVMTLTERDGGDVMHHSRL